MKLRSLFAGIFLIVMAACAALPTTSQNQNQPPEQTPTLSQENDNQPIENTRPTVRPDLEASDPATFSMAEGKLQLIEFFAYW